METVYQSTKTIILFLIIVLLCQTAFGDKFAQNMSMAILFSMLILNADRFTGYLSTVTNNLTK